jgi:hypothetical protein
MADIPNLGIRRFDAQRPFPMHFVPGQAIGIEKNAYDRDDLCGLGCMSLNSPDTNDDLLTKLDLFQCIHEPSLSRLNHPIGALLHKSSLQFFCMVNQKLKFWNGDLERFPSKQMRCGSESKLQNIDDE